MTKIVLSFILMIIVFTANAQSVEVMNYDQLEKRLDQKNDTVYLVNFWATWCKPCIEELPDFLKLNEELKDRNFKLILVSLDFSNQIEKRVVPFLKKHEITSEVILLDDPDANTWINKVDASWDGAIPVTLLLHKGKKAFYKGTLTYEELSKMVKEKMN